MGNLKPFQIEESGSETLKHSLFLWIGEESEESLQKFAVEQAHFRNFIENSQKTGKSTRKRIERHVPTRDCETGGRNR